MLIAIVLGIWACKPDAGSEESYLSNGYRYVNYTNKPGPKPVTDQVVSIDFDIIDDFDNILSDSRKANVRPTIQVPAAKNQQTKRNPLLALIEVMAAGDSASVFVPIDSLDSPPQEFMQSKMIEYRVVVHAIESQEAYMDRIGNEEKRIRTESLEEAREALELYQSGKLDDRVIEKNGDVKLAIIKDTDGLIAEYNELAVVHYYGFLADGKIFDNSYKIGKPFAFQIGQSQVIQGWDVAIPDVPEGATAIIDIPYQMAYGNEGKAGVVPPRSDLIYWVKMDRVEKSKKPEE